MVVEKTRPEAPGAERPRSEGLAVSLWVLIPLILFATYWWQLFESFGGVGCEGVCDLELAFGARAAYPWEVGVSVVLAIVIAVVLKVRRKPTFWGPLVGVALVVAAALVTSILFQVGLAPMYERNDRIARGEAPADAPLPLPDPVGRWEIDADGDPHLTFSADGTVVGDDGCNALAGTWTQDPDGRINLATRTETANACGKMDAWLGQGQSADIRDDFLYVNGEAGTATGGLKPVR